MEWFDIFQSVKTGNWMEKLRYFMNDQSGIQHDLVNLAWTWILGNLWAWFMRKTWVKSGFRVADTHNMNRMGLKSNIAQGEPYHGQWRSNQWYPCSATVPPGLQCWRDLVWHVTWGRPTSVDHWWIGTNGEGRLHTWQQDHVSSLHELQGSIKKISMGMFKAFKITYHGCPVLRSK